MREAGTRSLDNLTNEDAVSNGWTVHMDGGWLTVAKATYEEVGHSIMKATKRMPVHGGHLYQTTTEIVYATSPDSQTRRIVVAEALCFVPLP